MLASWLKKMKQIEKKGTMASKPSENSLSLNAIDIKYVHVLTKRKREREYHSTQYQMGNVKCLCAGINNNGIARARAATRIVV